MKLKALLTAVLLAATNLAWEQGGLGIDNVEQHMNVNHWAKTNTDRPKIVTQGQIDKFNIVVENRNRIVVNTSKFKHSYDGQS